MALDRATTSQTSTKTARPLDAVGLTTALSRAALPLIFLALALAALSIVVRPSDRMVLKPLIDDAYYSLSVSENIADGESVTIDGENLTNGFQPLFTFAAVPAFALTEGKAEAIRIVTVVEWALFVATGLLLGMIARDAWPTRDGADRRLVFWIAAVSYLSATFAFLTHFNGLETGALLFMYALAWFMYQRVGVSTVGRCAAFGAVLGLLVLTRVDAAIFVVVIAALQLLFQRQASIAQTTLRAGVVSGVALLVSSPWWIYNVVEFGALMPSSGTAEQDISLMPTRIPELLIALFRAGAPWIAVSSWDGLSIVHAARVVAVLAVVALAWFGRKAMLDAVASLHDRPLLRRHLEFGSALLLTCGIFAIWYLETSGAHWFYDRYLAPLSLITALVLAYGLWQAAERWVLVPPFVLAGMAVLTLGLGVAPQFVGEPYAMYDQTLLVREHVPDGEVVAAGQTGGLGFFREDVVNLDGKVNGDAIAYQSNMWEYLREQDIVWFVDEPYYFRYLGPDLDSSGWTPVATRGTFTLFKYDGTNAPP